MDTKRKNQLEFCNVCQNRSFDMKKGIICSLTGEKATFSIDCEDYKEDEKAILKRKAEIERRKSEEEFSKTAGLSSIGIKNGFVTGFILIVLFIGFNLATIVFFDRIFFISFTLLILCIISITWQVSKNRNKKDIKEDEVLDQ